MCYSFLLALSLVLTACVPPQPIAALKETTQLSVRGEAIIRVVPDQVEMFLEAVTTAETADEALRENNTAIAKLQQLLAAEGLSPGDYHTRQFSIQPQWSNPPRPAPANWTPQIVGYRVTNGLQIATARIELAGRLLALGPQAGVNRAGNLKFVLADPEVAQRQAIAAATESARQRAETLAQAAGVKLGQLLEAAVEASGFGGQPLMMAEMNSARAAQSSVPLSAGEVEVSAAVQLRYAIGK
jgi:uncharacterized protein YggE